MTGHHEFAALAATGITLLMWAAAFVLIGTLLTMLSNRLVNGFTPPFGRTAAVVVVTLAIQYPLQSIGGRLLGHAALLGVGFWISRLVGVLVGAWLLNRFVPRPGGTPMGLGKAALVVIVADVFGALIAVLLMVAFLGVMFH